MSLAPGARIGPYEVLGTLGVGGMGEVYLAKDTKLNRDVAIKVLPDLLAGDPERLARFTREAHTLASLNHPNIAAIYGMEPIGASGGHALVMENVEGEDLAAHMARGPMPPEEALPIARQIADALEAAHEQGIVHRDLKPQNVKVRADGTVKVLDFGLAKAIDPGGTSGANLAHSPTLTAHATQMGTILGTAAYMSPEQAKGKSVDRRADIWAFGVVVYEMLTGQRLFDGETVSETLAAVLRQDIDLAPLPAGTPEPARRLIARCLDRDPRTRLRDIGEARIALATSMAEPSAPPALPRAPVSASWGWRVVLLAAGAAVGAGLALFFARDGSRGGVEGPPTVMLHRLTDVPGPETQPDISPDGRQVLYSSDVSGHRHIYLLRVGGAHAIDLTGNVGSDDEQARFSPSGDQIVFRSSRDGGGLFVMGATGESVRRLTNAGFDPAWSRDGRFIAYATEAVFDPYSRLSEAELWTLELATGKTTKLYAGDAVQPAWSPDGTRIAFWANRGGQRDIWTIAATGGPPQAVTSDTPTDWSPEWTPDGRWLYFQSDRGGSMNVWRVAVDQQSGRVAGVPQPVTNGFRPVGYGRLSADGKRMIVMGYDRTTDLTIAGFDPANPENIVTKTELRNQSLGYCDPSPDGVSLVCSTSGRQEDLVVVRSDGTETRRLMDDAFKDRAPTWSPDGKTIAFMSTRSGHWESWAIQADGSGLRQLTDFDGDTFQIIWSPDGKSALVASISRKSVWRIDTSRLNTAATAESLPDVAKSGALEVMSWSPDGRFLSCRRFTESQRGAPVVWDMAGKSLLDLELHGTAGDGYSIGFLPDSRSMLLNGEAGLLLVHLPDGRSRKLKDGASYDDYRLSRDGRTLLIQHPVFDADIWLLDLAR